MPNKIKEVRLIKNITQKQLSERSGVCRPYISMLENGKALVIKNTTMENIANALDESVEDIFFNRFVHHSEHKGV